MSRPTKFSAIPYDLLDAVVDRSAIFMYAWLRRFSDWNTGDLQCTLAELASRSHSDIGTVRRALKILQTAGVVALVGDPGKQRWVIDPPTELLHPRKYSDEGRKSSNRDGGSGLRWEEFHTGGRDRTVLSTPTNSANPHTDAPGSEVGRSVNIFDQGGPSLGERSSQDQHRPTKEDRSSKAGDDLQDREDPTHVQVPAQLTIGGEPEPIEAPAKAKGIDPAVLRLEALWVGLWQKNQPKPGKARDERLRALRSGLKEHGEDKARSLLIGHAKNPHHIQGNYTDPSLAFRPKNEDKFLANAAAFATGAPIPGSDERGGGRGGDRAHGGPHEVLMGQAALDKVAAETRERRERDRKQAEESSTPEAIEARRLAFEAMDAITARKGGGRR